jgi:hypothetical protein
MGGLDFKSTESKFSNEASLKRIYTIKSLQKVLQYFNHYNTKKIKTI